MIEKEYLINVPSKKWKDRKLSWLIKCLLANSDKTIQDAADCIGINKSYFNNKLNRDSFSFTDILVVSELTGNQVCIVNKDTGDAIPIDICSWLEGYDPGALSRIKNFETNRLKTKYEEYLIKKAEVEEMEKKYMFQYDNPK